MAQATEELLAPRRLEPLADLVRVQAGRFPGTEVLDLASPRGVLARGLAREAPSWTVYAGGEVPGAPDNVETVDLDPGNLGFEDDQLAAVVGAWIDEPIATWSPAVLAELRRVLAPGGRLLFLFRAPSPRNPAAPRQLPEPAVRMLEEAGFEHAAERRLHLLADGSALLRLRAVEPEG